MAGCIFCGQGTPTKTHIFRKAWIERVMPSDQPYVHRHLREASSTSEEFDRWWSEHEFRIAPRAACQPCNGGWMDKIDRAGELLAEPMVFGRRHFLRLPTTTAPSRVGSPSSRSSLTRPERNRSSRRSAIASSTTTRNRSKASLCGLQAREPPRRNTNSTDGRARS
jgi:hypothetical protein